MALLGVVRLQAGVCPVRPPSGEPAFLRPAGLTGLAALASLCRPTAVFAILGALVMQSLRSGMGLMNVDAPLQNIVVGVVLVAAVGLDTFYRRRSD